MVYITRPGISLIRICDTDILVASRSEWEKCPVIRPVPRLWAACWHIMEQGKTDREVVTAFASLLKKPEEEIRAKLNKVFATLTSEGLMIESGDDT